MNAVAPIAPQQRLSVLQAVANRYNMEPAAFEQTLRATVVPPNATREQFAACLVVANEYRLNPLTKEIYFFPARGGGVVPMVGVDGWARIINEHPKFDGMEFETDFRADKVFSVTCRMYRTDRVRPIVITEYYSECSRATDPWKTAPARMLRHKAMIQAARYSFGFSGIYDEDDAAMIRADIDLRPNPQPPRPPASPRQSETQEHRIPASDAGAPSTPKGPPSPPKPPSAPAAPQPGQHPPADVDDATDWTSELQAYDNQLSSIEDSDALVEAIEMYGARFADAPKSIRAEAGKLEQAIRESLERQGGAP